MTTQFHCQDKEQLIWYLYEEGGDESGLLSKRTCRPARPVATEVADLRSVRATSAAGSRPTRTSRFRIVRDAPVARRAVVAGAGVGRPRSRRGTRARHRRSSGQPGSASRQRRAYGENRLVEAGDRSPRPGAAGVGRAHPPRLPPVRRWSSAGMSEAEVRKALDALESKLRTDFAPDAQSQAGSVQRVRQRPTTWIAARCCQQVQIAG